MTNQKHLNIIFAGKILKAVLVLVGIIELIEVINHLLVKFVLFLNYFQKSNLD